MVKVGAAVEDKAEDKSAKPAIPTIKYDLNSPLPTEHKTKHHEYMRAALDMVWRAKLLQSVFKRANIHVQAEKALNTDEVPVGCVFVHNGKIIGRGMNDTNNSLCVCY